MRRLLVLSLVITACKGSKDGGPSSQPGAAAAGSAVAVGSAAAATADAAVTTDAAFVEDPKIREAYRAGLRKGRKAVSAKNYKEAIAGFDEALAAKKNDPRALGERGFVKLLEGSDLDAALKDFDIAASGTKDPKLLSEIWFNRGLVEEKRGNADNALAAFTVANTFRPTKAAQQKLAGKSTCPVTARTDGSTLTDAKAATGTDWLTLAKAMSQDSEDGPKTPSEALTWLTREPNATEPSLPAMLLVGDLFEMHMWLVWKQGTTLHAVPVVTSMGGRCPGSIDGSIVSANAKYVHVRASEEIEGGYTYVCQGKGDEIVECTDKPGEVSLGTACQGGATTVRDVVVELATGKVVAAADQPDGKLAKVELAADGLKLSGQGCDRTLPLAP